MTYTRDEAVAWLAETHFSRRERVLTLDHCPTCNCDTVPKADFCGGCGEEWPCTVAIALGLHIAERQAEIIAWFDSLPPSEQHWMQLSAIGTFRRIAADSKEGANE